MSVPKLFEAQGGVAMKHTFSLSLLEAALDPRPKPTIEKP